MVFLSIKKPIGLHHFSLTAHTLQGATFGFLFPCRIYRGDYLALSIDFIDKYVGDALIYFSDSCLPASITSFAECC